MNRNETEARTENNAGGTRMNGTGVWILCCLISAVAELILICCKIAGLVTWSWPAVLLSYFWIPIAVMVAFVLLAVGIHIFCRAMRRYREWKRRNEADRRIIRQAKAIGAWDKRPTPLGGRALELKAWEDFKIKRLPGETDAQLRRRCMAKADEELAAVPREGGGHHGL